jgi:hypothetical protein
MSFGYQRGSVGARVLGGCPVLVPFVYLVACRLFALVLLLARGDRSKELELLVLRHELSILRRRRGGRSWRRATGSYWRR